MNPSSPHDVAGSGEAALLASGHSLGSVTHRLTGQSLSRSTPRWWIVAFGLMLLLLVLFTIALQRLLTVGVGIWGIRIPVAWGFDIVNFVWWIGIGHAGTLISAILLLLRQPWRTSINRFAEAMTLFAVMCAGLFPLLHLGRIWRFYYILPYPDTLGLWPQWRSPLVWDVFAVATYGTVSLMFWYVGLIPDLATLRDRATRRGFKRFYGVLALGWRGSARHWKHYQTAYLLLAGIATPLVVSVHSIVSFDFAVSIVPGWHVTMFPPYFVAGAIYCGFAMVLVLILPLRSLYHLHDFITPTHLDLMSKVMLATGLFVAYGYLMEAFSAWYSGNIHERFLAIDRATGPYAWAYLSLLVTNVLLPQALWLRYTRVTPWALFLVAVSVNVGMWLERFVIVVTSLHRDYLPSAWGYYRPTFWDWATFLGTVGLFLSALLLFVRVLPMIAVAEVREMVLHHAPPAAHLEEPA